MEKWHKKILSLYIYGVFFLLMMFLCEIHMTYILTILSKKHYTTFKTTQFYLLQMESPKKKNNTTKFFTNTIVLDIKIIYKITLPSPFLQACFHPYPLFQLYPQSKEIEISIWNINSTFNAQVSKIIMIIVQVGIMKIYVQSTLV